MRLSLCAAIVVFSIASLGLSAEANSKDAKFHWDRGSVEQPGVALLNHDQVVWRFRFDDKVGKPCFDPLGPVGGPSITYLSPPDHVWHYGLWFSWKLINKVNYWEINKKTGHSDGQTRWKNVKTELADDFSATISLDLEYGLPDQPALMIEHRKMTLSSPGPDGEYQIDWATKFTACDKDLLLDRTPPPTDNKGGSGGYAGLSLRMQMLKNVKAISTNGPVELDKSGRSRAPALALDYSGEVEGSRVGVAMLDHPSNPRSPTPWYVINDGHMCYYNASLLCFEPMPVKAGESFALRYRLMVHPGAWDAAQLTAKQKQFAQEKP